MFARPHRARPTSLSLSSTGGPRRLAHFLGAMVLFGRQRQALSKLDDHMLRDIGLTRESVEAELAKPLWDVPTHWRR